MLYLVRHGKTQWNEEHKMQGWLDAPLTSEGRLQARKLAKHLKNEPITAIYSSDAPRAVSTAEIINQYHNLQLNPMKEFREINLGIWEGQHIDKIKESNNQMYNAFWSNPEKFQIEGAEKFEEVKNRAIVGLNFIINAHPEDNAKILIVAHTVVLKILFSYFKNRPLARIWEDSYINPTSLSIIQLRDRKYDIILEGNTSHYELNLD